MLVRVQIIIDYTWIYADNNMRWGAVCFEIQHAFVMLTKFLVWSHYIKIISMLYYNTQ